MPIKTPKWRNMVILVLGFMAIVLFFEIVPRLMNTTSLVFDWIDQSRQIEQSDRVAKQLQLAKQKNSDVKGYINGIVSDYEESQNASSILQMLDEIAAKSKVNIATIKPRQIVQHDNLWLQPIEVELISKYENYYNFVRFLENSQKVVLIKEIFMERENSVNGSLQIRINLEVYLNL
jgi:Tfp pilus assembly protein PilO